MFSHESHSVELTNSALNCEKSHKNAELCFLLFPEKHQVMNHSESYSSVAFSLTPFSGNMVSFECYQLPAAL